MDDKLRPSISYLQRLGPEYLDQIFKHSRWVLEQDADLGFEVSAGILGFLCIYHSRTDEDLHIRRG